MHCATLYALVIVHCTQPYQIITLRITHHAPNMCSCLNSLEKNETFFYSFSSFQVFIGNRTGFGISTKGLTFGQVGNFLVQVLIQTLASHRLNPDVCARAIVLSHTVFVSRFLSLSPSSRTHLSVSLFLSLSKFVVLSIASARALFSNFSGSLSHSLFSTVLFLPPSVFLSFLSSLSLSVLYAFLVSPLPPSPLVCMCACVSVCVCACVFSLSLSLWLSFALSRSVFLLLSLSLSRTHTPRLCFLFFFQFLSLSLPFPFSLVLFLSRALVTFLL